MDLKNLGLGKYYYYIRPVNDDLIDLRLLLQNTFLNLRIHKERTTAFFFEMLFPYGAPNNVYFNWLIRSKRVIEEYYEFIIEKIYFVSDVSLLDSYKNLVIILPNKSDEEEFWEELDFFEFLHDDDRFHRMNCYEYKIAGNHFNGKEVFPFRDGLMIDLYISPDDIIELDHIEEYKMLELKNGQHILKDLFQEELEGYNPLFNLINSVDREIGTQKLFNDKLEPQYPKLKSNYDYRR